ncbi:MAG: serine/threonine protein kinase [Myxococcaceae bacterium]
MAHPPCSACGSTAGPEHLCPGLSAQLVGKVLDGRYQIEAILGQGGMGMVFQAIQTSVKRPVAVKTLHPSLATAPTFFERFRREAEIASRLRHPNVITIFDFGRAEDGTCYYVMELLQGESLKQMVKRDGPMSLRRAVRVVCQASLGLAHAHIQGCIHRDLKPHNIMVQHIDGQEFVKVLDFGLVKAMEQDDTEQLTSTGQVLGTPQYMPPEQAGGEVVDQRSDLYSMAGVFYYCLTGASPFGANTVRKALTAALNNPVPLVSTRRKGAPVPRAVDEVFRKGLAGEKDDRYQTAEEFIADMNASIAGLSDAELDALPDGRVDDKKDSGSGSHSGAGSPKPQKRGTPPRPGSGSGGSRSAKAPSNVILQSQGLRPDQATISSAGRRATAPEIPSMKGVGATPPPGASGRPAGMSTAKKVALLAVPLAIFAVGGAVVAGLRDQEKPPAIPATVAGPSGPTGSAAVAMPQLPPVPHEVTVKLVTVPAGAAVLEDGVQIGTTPLDYHAPRGELRALSFQLASYVEVKRSFKYSSDDKLEVTLEPLPKAAPTKVGGKKKGPDIPTFE